mgnify:CR=1 FL=1
MPYILQTNQLTKSIGGKNLVTNVSMHVKKGEIYGFLGPNGAGKTTVMKMLTNLWKPTEGSIELFGKKLTPTSYEVLKRMGSIIEFPTFYDHLDGRENLKLHCEYMGYYNPGSIENALEMLNLADAGKKPVRSYSLGMKQKPRDCNNPFVVSSHILSEIESIADTVGVINHGVLMKEVTMKEISEMSLAYIELNVINTKKASYVLADKMGLDNFKIVEDGKIRIYDHHVSTQELSKVLALNDVEIVAIGKKAESLEDYFLKMTAEV